MQPQKTSSSDIVTLLNIDDEDFYFNYNASEGNPPYVIESGKPARFPKWLADHALKHLLDKVLTKKKIRVTHENERAALAEEIVVGVESLHRRREPTDDERLRAEVEELNKPSSLDAILAKKKAQEKKIEEEKIDTTQKMDKLPKVKEEKFEGLPEEEVVTTSDTEAIELKVEPKKKSETKVEEKKEEVITMPTRKELYEYAEKQNLVLDEPDKDNKTMRQRLDDMKIPEVVKVLQYPLEED